MQRFASSRTETASRTYILSNLLRNGGVWGLPVTNVYERLLISLAFIAGLFHRKQVVPHGTWVMFCFGWLPGHYYVVAKVCLVLLFIYFF